MRSSLGPSSTSSRTLVLAVLLVLFAATATAQLDALAKAVGKKYFGTATDNSELSNARYYSILTNTSEFGQLTPGNGQKWEYTEPSPGVFSFTAGDVVANLSASTGQLLRCHNLVWYQQLPSWVSSTAWTAADLTAALQLHISTEVAHYRGRCYAWDVVNEALADDGTYRADVFYDVLGESYVAAAFAAAAAADPDAKLYYNDYNIEYAGAKADAALALVSAVQAAGARIDGVGLQAHFVAGSAPDAAAQVANMQAFAALGVEIAVTELDVRVPLPATAADLALQSADYANTVAACLQVAECVGVTVWDFYDPFSWVPSTFSGYGAADLWFDNFTVHPAYDAIVAVLKNGSA